MDTKGMTSVLVGILIASLILASTIPIFAGVAEGERTFVNDGPRMAPLGEDTITITYANDDWKIDDRDLGFGSFPITQGTIMIFGQTGSNRAGFYYQSDNDTYARTNVNRSGEYTWVYDGANKTVTSTAIVNEHTYTSTNTYVEEIYYNDPDGDYAWFGAKPTNAYIPDDWSKFNAWSNEAEHFYAIIGDTITVDGSAVTDGVTATLTTEDVPNYAGVKNITSYTLTVEGQEPIDCRGFILPYEVVGSNTIANSNVINTIMNILPLLAGVGLLMGAVYYFISRR